MTSQVERRVFVLSVECQVWRKLGVGVGVEG